MQPADTRDSLRLDTVEAMQALGARIGAGLRTGEAVCLFGPLGAGKSTLARGLVREVTGDPDQEAPSPTFTLMQPYEGPRFPLAHFDLYRLAGAAEAYEIGLEEALDQGAAVIEWSERLGDALPVDRLDVRLRRSPADADADVRWAQVRGFGAWSERASDLKRDLARERGNTPR